jgi:hypothetical protein
VKPAGERNVLAARVLRYSGSQVGNTSMVRAAIPGFWVHEDKDSGIVGFLPFFPRAWFYCWCWFRGECGGYMLICVCPGSEHINPLALPRRQIRADPPSLRMEPRTRPTIPMYKRRSRRRERRARVDASRFRR